MTDNPPAELAAATGSASDAKTDSEWNDLRCIAHEIILDLHNAKQQSQIELLLMACMLSQKSLDPEAHRQWCQNALDTMKAAAEWDAKKQNM